VVVAGRQMDIALEDLTPWGSGSEKGDKR